MVPINSSLFKSCCIDLYLLSFLQHQTSICQKNISIYQPTNAHRISHKTLLKHFKTLRHVSILSDHHQGALFLAKVMLQYSQFNWYLQTRCCGSVSCCVGMCCGADASHCPLPSPSKYPDGTSSYVMTHLNLSTNECTYNFT